MDVSPVLAPPPRILDARWNPTLSRQKRQRLLVGLVLVLMMILGLWTTTYRPNRHLAVSDRVVLLATCTICTLGIMALVLFQQRRRVWLFRHGEERVATVIKDRRLLLMRELWVVVPHENSAITIPFSFPAQDAQFDEFERKGQRLIRVLVDPRKPRRCQPIPRLDLT